MRLGSRGRNVLKINRPLPLKDPKPTMPAKKAHRRPGRQRKIRTRYITSTVFSPRDGSPAQFLGNSTGLKSSSFFEKRIKGSAECSEL